MFVSLSKTLTKFGGIRLGIRITKKNAWWMWIAIIYVQLFKLMWYMLVMCLWIIYAVYYGLWKLICAPFRLIRKLLWKK